MSVAAVGAVGAAGGTGAIYALSPYLNGVIRTSDAVAVAVAATQTAATAAAQRTARATTTATAQAAPFANPAIAQIAQQFAIAASLSGDAGFLIQSYGAVALATSPLALAPVYAQPTVPLTPPVAPVPAIAPAAEVAA